MKRFGRIAVLAITAAGLGLVLTVASSRDVRAASTDKEKTVLVGNTTTDPLPATVVNLPATQPFGWITNGETTYLVPVGKRLVITDVSGISNPLFYANVLISATSGGTQTGLMLPFSAGLAGDSYVGRSVQMYADPGTVVSLKLTATAPGPYKTNPPAPTIYVNGYLVTLP